jgi:hypothetical protein
LDDSDERPRRRAIFLAADISLVKVGGWLWSSAA